MIQVDLVYHCVEYHGYKYIDYDDATDKGSVLWHDPDFYILWSIVTLILSDKDASAGKLIDLKR